MALSLNEPELNREKTELEAFLARPDAFSDPNFTDKTRRLNELSTLLSKLEHSRTLSEQLDQARSLAGADDELAELAKAEIPDLEAQLQQIENELQALLVPKDPNDDKNVII